VRCESKQLSEAIAFLERGDWKAAHEIVQQDEDSALACWAHGIVHIMEGDLPNARYWYRRAKRDFSDDVKAEIPALKKTLSAS
jgi:hypothetical protein